MASKIPPPQVPPQQQAAPFVAPSSAVIFNAVKKSAARLGSCDPHWLKSETPPHFNVTESSVGAANTGLPEMVLLHGLFGALSNWDSVFPLFEKYTRPLALQLPIISGHRSEVKVKPIAAFTEFFVRLRGLAPVALCGNSMGGHIALRLCLTSPELVDCLILSGSSGLYEHSVDSLPVRPDRKFVREHMGRVFNGSQFVTEPAIEEIYKILTDRSKVLNLIHAARSAKKDNLQDLLPLIKVPTLLLWGEDDLVTTMEVAKQFHKLIPNSELHTIKKCGHAPMIEHPQWFSDHVERFLKQHSRYYRQKLP